MADSAAPSSFADLGLTPLVVENLDRMGYRQPWPIQAAAIGPILAGKDFIGLAQTGRGKTAAYFAPLVAKLLPRDRTLTTAERLRVLVICPTRELAKQIADEGGGLVRKTGLKVECVFGKVGMGPQVKRLNAGVDILVGTPGRLNDLVNAGAISLAAIRHVVVDEADRMLDMGFRPQVDRILRHVREERQSALFTATMPHDVEQLARHLLREPERAEVDPESTPVSHVDARLISTIDRQKVPLLVHLLQGAGEGGEDGDGGVLERGVLVFCATRRRVGWVGAALRRHGVRADMLHGDRSPKQRAEALERFRDGDLDVLVATDVASRGLHIERVRTVVNYDIPGAPEEYVHRVGRAAHGGRGRGEAISFVTHYDEAAWERVLERTGELIVMEEIEGFAPPVRRSSLMAHGGTGGRGSESTTRPRQSRKGKSIPSRGRGRSNRPIKPGQLPGGGVKRIEPPGDAPMK